MQYSFKLLSRHVCLLLLIAATVAFSACVKSSGPAPDEGTKVEIPVVQPKAVTLAEVEEAYKKGDTILAERLAGEYTSRSGLDAQQLGRGWRILALSAIENKKTRVALTALDRWRHSINGADGTAEWCNAWYEAHTQLPLADAIKRAEEIIKTESGPDPRPILLIREAKLFVFEQRFIQGNGRASIPGMIEMHEMSGYNEKRDLENRTWKLLHTADRPSLNRLVAYTSDDNENRYPFALIRLENSRRMFWVLKNQAAARENVAFLRDGSQLADKSVFSRWNQPDYSALEKVRVNNDAIALVLPLTGQYGNLSEKIVRGAEAARRGFEANGKKFSIHVIDSDQPNWLIELNRLPKNVKIVGGPLRVDEYSAVKSMSFSGGRHFFTFLPRMDDNDEGRLAWRFFPSREDQVRVMIDYAQQLGVRDYAIFAPTPGEYAQSMFDLFYYQAVERDLYITRSGYYPDKEYKLWVKSVADFLGPPPENGEPADSSKTQQPKINFQAMFLPDTWSNSARIISHVFYAADNKILFMGTNLWEPGLASQQKLATRNYRLAIFPGAWDQNTTTPSGQVVRGTAALGGKYDADFWFALGYDFALATASLNLPQDASAEDINAALGKLPELPWSGAPVRWNGQGLAAQDLFVLTPAESGFTKANTERIKERLKKGIEDGSYVPEDAPVQLKPEEMLPPLKPAEAPAENAN